jgi:predicted aspartyl protease
MRALTRFILAAGSAILAGHADVVAEFLGGQDRIVVNAYYPGDSPEILVNVAGHSRPLRFSVDTGASNTILDSLTAAELGIEATGVYSIVGADTGKIKTKVANDVALQIEGFRLRNIEALITDLSGLASQGHSVDGILGYDLFSKVVVIVDEDERRLTLIDPARFQYTGSGSVLPLTFGGRGKWIYIPATAKVPGAQPETLQFFVDTGSSDAVDTILLKKSKERVRRTQTGNGLGQPSSGVFGRVEWFRLGDLTLRDAPSVCCGNPGNENMMGGAVLRRFVVTFDYPRKRMILERGKHFDDHF